jgi:predicted RNA-binding protein YlxR (DUF448 family)
MRWVVDPQEPTRLLPDPKRRMPGRGAWLHPIEQCAHLAVRRRGFARAFRSGGIHHDLSALLNVMPTESLSDSVRQETQTESGSGKVETR